MDDRITLIILYIIFLFTNRHNFFRIIYSGLLMFNMYYLVKNKFNIKLKQWIIYLFAYISSYYLIKDPNPFYYLVTFYLPLPNLFRGIFIIMFITFIFNKYILELDFSEEIMEKKEEKEEIKEEQNDEVKDEQIEEKKEEIKEEAKVEQKEDIKEEKKEEIKEKIIEEEIKDKKEEQKDLNDNKEKDIIDDGKIDEIKEENETKEKNETKDKKDEDNYKKFFFLSNEVRYLWKNKESLFWFFICLILLRLGIYFYEIKYWVYVEDNPFENKSNQSKPKTMYYISAVIYNMEPIIKDWISEMKQLIDYLGRDRVIVSIVENGDSTDKTRKHLQFFENYLINHKVINIINTERKEKKEGVDRIRFLAKLRNRSLDFLYRIGDLDFDNTKIIFFNDIIFRYEDILKLLFTNNGNYDTVCAMDYYEGFYDTWTSIGLDGKQFRRYFPYFYNKELQDAYINGEIIRTFSCWNGVNVISAKVFEDRDKLFFRTGTKIRQSECTLLHADMYLMGYRKIFVNTQVAVAYTYEYYYKNHYLYPWTKNLITYFYYYFKYGFIKRNYNMTNIIDSDITMYDNLEEVVKEYMGKDIK